MDDVVFAVLRELATLEEWPVDRLPEAATLDLLRELDAEGWIEVTFWSARNVGKEQFRLERYGEWCSPTANPGFMGDWPTLLRKTKRSEVARPPDVRVSERGRAALAKAMRTRGEWRNPRMRKAWEALIAMWSALECVADQLRSDVLDYGLRDMWARSKAAAQYCPPAAIVRFAEERSLFEGEARFRASVDAPPMIDGLPVIPHWVVRADQYWRSWMTFREQAQSCRRLVEAAAPELDGEESRPLKRASTLLLRAIDDAEGSTNLRHAWGWNPLRYPESADTEIRKAAKAVGEWVETLRALANQTGTPMPNAEAVVEAANKPDASTTAPANLAQVETGIAAVHSVENKVDDGTTPAGRANESRSVQVEGPKPEKKPKPTRRERQMKWLAEAMLTVRDHPEWSDAAIARSVGINKSRLSRSREYRAAARMARSSKTPDGSVTITDGIRSLEGVDDSFDPNRRASRQSLDEEDTDDRIDREIRKRNAKRNGRR